MGNECVYICFVDSGTNYHRHKLWGMSDNLICKRVWWARVVMGISKDILCRKYVGVIYTVGGGDCIIIIIIIIKWDIAQELYTMDLIGGMYAIK